MGPHYGLVSWARGCVNGRLRSGPGALGAPRSSALLPPPTLALAPAAGPCQKSIRQADRQLHRGAYAHTKDRQAEASGRRASGYNKVLAN